MKSTLIKELFLPIFLKFYVTYRESLLPHRFVSEQFLCQTAAKIEFEKKFLMTYYRSSCKITPRFIPVKQVFNQRFAKYRHNIFSIISNCPSGV